MKKILILLLAFFLVPLMSGQALALSCGDLINESTTMTGDLTGCVGTAITINADNVVFDCDGYLISTTGSAIYSIYDNITIKNCNITTTDNYAIRLNNVLNSFVLNNILNFVLGGIYIEGVSVNNTVVGNQLFGTQFHIYIYRSTSLNSYNNITNNTIINPSGWNGINLRTSYNRVIGNHIELYAYGITYGAASIHDNYFEDNYVNVTTYSACNIGGNNNIVLDSICYAYQQDACWAYGSNNRFENTLCESPLQLRSEMYSTGLNVWINMDWSKPRMFSHSLGKSFNMKIGNIWLNTSGLTASNDVIRTIISMDQKSVHWIDNNTNGSTPVNYTISGLEADRQYDIYEDGLRQLTLTADSKGELPWFSDTLDSAHEYEARWKGKSIVSMYPLLVTVFFLALLGFVNIFFRQPFREEVEKEQIVKFIVWLVVMIISAVFFINTLGPALFGAVW